VEWRDLDAGAPDLAALASAEFERSGMALVGTLRRDGFPRISCVYPYVLEGVLYLAMMWRSRKALDLMRDPRLVLHNAVSTNLGNELEVILTGRAREVPDEEVRHRYLEAVPSWGDRQFHLFAVDVETAATVRYEGGEQHVKVWPKGVELRRPY
jgi:hypothetical protein